jgi:alanine-synthesizing transaminase
MFSDRTNWNLSPNRLSQALAQHRANGKPLLDLTASNPTECGFQYATHALMRALCSPRTIEYTPDPRGLETARRAVATYYSARNIKLSLEKLLLTTSTSEGYSFVFRLLCNPGDEFLIPSPSYPLFDFLADLQDIKLVRYPLVYDHGWQIDLHALEQAITPRTRGIIIVNPNNPTGHFIKPAELAAINQLCASRQMAILADEVFFDFSHMDFSLMAEPPLSLAANQQSLTFTMSGLSKISGLPQMKLAWLAISGPEELKKEALARLDVIADTYLSVSAPIQLAAPVFFDMRHGFQEQVVARVRQNLAELDRQLSAQKACSRLEVEGGWYAILRVPATRPDEELALDLLEQKGVYVHPGHFYDFRQDGYLVVSLITPEKDFAEGIKRVLAES